MHINNNDARLRMLIRLINEFMPLNKWGFDLYRYLYGRSRPDIRLSSGTKTYPVVIYESEHCRVKFLLDRERHGDELHIYYGRLHAPDDERIFEWNGTDRYCWHNFELALKYLDGVSSKEAATSRSRSPMGIQKFLDLNLTKTIEQPEWLTRMHATAWEYYGHRLFQLFDRNKPELWEQYTQYVKEYFDIVGTSPNVIPPWHHIC